jgi:hypothetical protein
MPLLLHNYVHILSDAGLGMAMFSLGMRISCNPIVNLFIFTRPGNTICLQGDFSFQANLTKKMNLSSKCEKNSILGHES